MDKFVVYTGENTLNKIYQECHNPNENNYINSKIINIFKFKDDIIDYSFIKNIKHLIKNNTLLENSDYRILRINYFINSHDEEIDRIELNIFVKYYYKLMSFKFVISSFEWIINDDNKTIKYYTTISTKINPSFCIEDNINFNKTHHGIYDRTSEIYYFNLIMLTESVIANTIVNIIDNYINTSTTL